MHILHNILNRFHKPRKRSLKVVIREEKRFFTIIGLFILAILIFKDNPSIAMWIGFALAGYSSTANDSIQTLGTFLSSNQKTKWWILWIFVGGIMIAILGYSWMVNSGDTAYGRLEQIPEVESFNILQLIAPVVLIVLTRFRIPVSTTFLLLASFSSSKTIIGMLQKTLMGYFIAFVVGISVWAIVARMMRKKQFFTKSYNKKSWRVAQWITTAYLWSSWLMQDHSNTVVFLPRSLSAMQFALVTIFLFIIMGVLIYLRGGKIQAIINEKTDVVDVRAATIIDFVFGTILLIFKQWNNLPMSTTWVFLGLLAGREVSLSELSGHKKPYSRTLLLVMKDLGLASIGLVISLILAWISHNPM